MAGEQAATDRKCRADRFRRAARRCRPRPGRSDHPLPLQLASPSAATRTMAERNERRFMAALRNEVAVVRRYRGQPFWPPTPDALTEPLAERRAVDAGTPSLRAAVSASRNTRIGRVRSRISRLGDAAGLRCDAVTLSRCSILSRRSIPGHRLAPREDRASPCSVGAPGSASRAERGATISGGSREPADHGSDFGHRGGGIGDAREREHFVQPAQSWRWRRRWSPCSHPGSPAS